MAAKLTEAEFSKHMNTKFHIEHNASASVTLELVEVKGYAGSERYQGGMERFSVFFEGPPDTKLPQQTYTVQHPGMGEFDIFLVPIGGDEQSLRYEAVFNYFK